MFLFLGYTQEIDPDPELFTATEIEWIREHSVINFGYDPTSPPYEILDNGTYKGIAGDYIKMIEIHTGIDMIPIPNSNWQKALKGLKSGKIKVVAVAGISEERKEYLEFTDPFIKDPLVIVTQSDFKYINSVNDLIGEKLILPEDYYTVDLINNDYPDFNIITAKNVKECLYQVSTGQADAFIGSLAVTSYHINNYGFSNLKIAAPTHYEYTELGLATTKDWSVFRDVVQKVLDHLSEEEHINIRSKWITVKMEDRGVSKKVKNYIIYGLIIIALIIVGFIFWNKTLMNEIKARKRIEEDLKRKNEEKELLLKEVHHRVKNNLQIVHSLLNMQSRQVDNDIALKVIAESKSRVMAMAIIHKILYESEDLSTIDVKKYVNSLSDNIKRIYISDEIVIVLNIDIQDVFLDIDKAIPVGLILNELLSNTYKHAFTNRKSGNIYITIKQLDNECQFNYSDDGIGIKSFDIKSYKTLGMNLIFRLANQLQTEAIIKKTTGFNLSFVFNY